VPKTSLGDMVQYFRNVCEVQRSRDLTDADLLRRFLADREGAAFAVLVQRHGPMVLGLCNRILGDLHSAEDALQATFMVLVRRSASLRCTGSLGNWLYAAAKRIALKARAKAIARRRLERRLETMPRTEPIDESTWQELRSILDDEIGKLPKKYRAVIILCHLESKSHEQAAKELSWPKTTLTSRLVRGRELLRQGLVRRGITLSAAAVVTALAQKATAAPVATMLTLNTVKAATNLLAGEALTGVGLSAGAVALAEEAMKRIFWMKATVLFLVLVLAFGAVGAGLASFRGFVEKSQPAKTAAVPLPTKQAAPSQEQKNEAEKLFRAMEKRILEAKSLKVVFVDARSLFGVPDDRGSWQILFAEGNRARLEFVLENPPGPMGRYWILSDGKHMSMRERKTGEKLEMRSPLKTPPKLNADVGLVLARCGGLFAFSTLRDLVAQNQITDLDTRLRASSFKLGAKEKIGKNEAQVIEYKTLDILGMRPGIPKKDEFGNNEDQITDYTTLDIHGKQGAKANVELWIDLNTKLPLRRRLAFDIKEGKEQTILTEIYSEFTLNPALDAKSFEVPPAKDKTAEGAPRDVGLIAK
jgi:RNA polymerase sigma factor (sigma-70 family)